MRQRDVPARLSAVTLSLWEKVKHTSYADNTPEKKIICQCGSQLKVHSGVGGLIYAYKGISKPAAGPCQQLDF